MGGWVGGLGLGLGWGWGGVGWGGGRSPGLFFSLCMERVCANHSGEDFVEGGGASLGQSEEHEHTLRPLGPF